ncbi:hypothetical protein QBC34DRAFT_413472 [Podospora aff. communis PSN243]|uniref:Clr5 domain-containing protein n=1 Tax=Podospora aff. communis PSN243 TaxID=3040156 RepID=A0AAV9G8U6_9PEZI|nr:hypothetical protein QBC34DRAFT_413472 [Podospora aff. communis PSN243]
MNPNVHENFAVGQWPAGVASANFLPPTELLPALATLRLPPSHQNTVGTVWSGGLMQSTAATACSTLPPAPASSSRKKKASTLRDSDWEPMKAHITLLYVEEGFTIRRLREVLSEEFQFQATERQTLSRIQKWGLDKKVKRKEALFMSRKLKQRRTHEPEKPDYVFTVRGRMQPLEKREQWEKRMDHNQVVFLPCSVPETPDGVSYKTPEDSGSRHTSTLSSPVPMDAVLHQPSILSPAWPMATSHLAASSSLVTSTTYGGERPTSSSLPTPKPVPNTNITHASPAASPMASTPGLVADTGFEGASPAPWNDDVHEAFCSIAGFDPTAEGPRETASVYLQKEAEELEMELISLEQAHRGNSSQALEAMSELFHVLFDQGRYKSAERIGIQRLLIHRERGQMKKTAEALSCLADIFFDQGDLQRADRAAKKAFETSQTAGADRSFTAFKSQWVLGMIQCERRQYEKAHDTYQNALRLLDRLFVANCHRARYQIAIMADMASLLVDQGRLSEAETWARRALKMNTWEQPYDLGGRLDARYKLVDVCIKQGRYDESTKMALESVAQCKEVYGLEHRRTAGWVACLGIIYTHQGHWEQAVSCLQASISVRTKILGPTHPVLFATWVYMLYMYIEQERWDQVEAALEKCQRGFSHGDPETASAVVSVLGAAIADARGRHDQALELSQESAARLEITDPLFGIYANNIKATVLRNLGMFEESEALASRTLDSSTDLLGPNHPDTLRSKANLALALLAKGHVYLAVDSMRRCVQSLHASPDIGPEHYLTRRSRKMLNEWVQTGDEYFYLQEATPWNPDALWPLWPL